MTNKKLQVGLQQHQHGVLLPLRALPGSRANGIRGCQDGALKVSVTQVAEKGKANKAIRDLLAKALGLRKSQLELASGATSQQKVFLVLDVEESELASRIAALLASTEQDFAGRSEFAKGGHLEERR
ncbi:MAG: DUF167 domain-containing protein [Planctomycetales bacterium]|nr:DUF167 domain-containing protein [Planctomycetales bacterium]